MANIAYFEIPADNVDRAKHFYHSLLGWQIEPTKAPASPAMVATQYRDITTGPAEEGKLNMGGLYRRQSNETIKSYVMVEDLENIKDSLTEAETRIFKGDERRMVEVLSGLSRELMDFRQTSRVHREIWEDMIEFSGKDFFGHEFAPYARDLRDEFTRINELAGNSRELVADLRETNDSLLNTKQNDIMRTLTIVTFIFYPATFIASLFTIPAAFVPIVGGKGGWTIILVLMVAVTALIWWFLKRKRWL